jgi:hypothetical protein
MHGPRVHGSPSPTVAAGIVVGMLMMIIVRVGPIEREHARSSLEKERAVIHQP